MMVNLLAEKREKTEKETTLLVWEVIYFSSNHPKEEKKCGKHFVVIRPHLSILKKYPQYLALCIIFLEDISHIQVNRVMVLQQTCLNGVFWDSKGLKRLMPVMDAEFES